MGANPYSTPGSNLETDYILNRHILWKVYFVFMTLLVFLSVFSIFTIEGKGVAEIISGILIVPAMLGFFGYVFSKKILTRKIWFINFYVQLGWGILYYFVSSADLSAGMDQQTYLITNGIMWIISTPYYIALFLYGSNSYQLWREKA